MSRYKKRLGTGTEYILSIILLILLVASFPASVIQPGIFANAHASLNIRGADGGLHETGFGDEVNQEEDLGTVQSPESLVSNISIKVNGGSASICSIEYVTEYQDSEILDSLTTFEYDPDPCRLDSSSNLDSNDVTITIRTDELSSGTYRGEFSATAQTSDDPVSAVYYFKFDVEEDGNSEPVQSYRSETVTVSDMISVQKNLMVAISDVLVITEPIVIETNSPPDTVIDSAVDGNDDSVEDSGSTASSSITFTFHAEDDGSDEIQLECSLDDAEYETCSSPHTEDDLAEGEHVFSVRATDDAGYTDSTPAFHTWTVESESDEAVRALAVDPDSGAAGESISVEGTGFTPGSTIDQLTIGVAGQSNHDSIMPDETLVTVDEAGDWDVSPVALPSDLVPGVYVVQATSSDSQTAQTTFQVLPDGPSFDVSLSTDTASIEDGDADGADIAMEVNSENGFSDSLELTVSNLPLGVNVVFSQSGDVIMEASGNPGGNTVTGSPTITPVVDGTLDITVNISADSGTSSGTYQVFFGAKDPSSGDSKARLVGVTVTATGTPSMTFSPLMAQPGSSIDVVGSNFGASETVTIEFNDLDSGTDGFSVTPSSLVTTSGGTFSAAFTVPDLAGGIYKVVASGSSGEATSTFQVLPVLDTATVQLQIAPKALVLAAGSDASQTVTIVPIGQFSSDIQLDATPEASGLDIEFLPADTLTITPGVPSPVSMEVSVSAGATPGSLIPIRVEAQDGGSTIATEYAYVRVADSGGDFFMSASPVDLVAARGTTVSSSLVLVTTGLAGTPDLSLSGLPDGITGEIVDITAIDTAGKATATVELSVPADAAFATSVFTLQGSFTGLDEKEISMSISVVSEAPISVESGIIDPTIVTENTPLYLTFPFGDDGTIELIVYSLATSTYGTTNIDYLILPDVPDEDESAGFSLLLTDGANLDSANPFVNVDYDVRMTVPGTDSEDLSVGFLDTGEDPPIWTPLPASSTFNGDACGDNSACATEVTHFSSWGLLAVAAVASSSGGGGSGHAVVLNQEAVEEEPHIEEPTFDAGHLPTAAEDGASGAVDTHEDVDVQKDESHEETAVPEAVSDALIPSVIEASADDPGTFFAGGWKIQPHVAAVDPLARFFEPNAKVTIVFDIERAVHEGSAQAGVIGYDIVDEAQRVIFSGQLSLGESEHERVVATVPSYGVYSLVIVGSPESQGSAQRVEGATIVVPWLTANTSVLVEAMLVVAAGVTGYAAFRHSLHKEKHGMFENVIDRYIRKIRFTIPTVVIAVAGLMLVAGFFIIFAGDKTAQETVAMWVTNVTTSVAAGLAVILFVKKRSGPHSKIELALAIGLVLWLGSRAVETWFNMTIPGLLPEEVLHHVYPGDFLLTFVTGHDLEVFNEALGGSFGWIYGLFTALKMGGFALFNFHLIKASRLFADRYGKKLSIAAMVAPAIFLGIIATAYVDVLLGQILLQDLAIHFGYVILISMMMVPSSILLVVLRKETHKELFWILSTLSLLSFVVAYSWQAFVPVGADSEQYLEWLEQNVWLSALLFGGDYLLMAFALLWEIRTHKAEHHEGHKAAQ